VNAGHHSTTSRSWRERHRPAAAVRPWIDESRHPPAGGGCARRSQSARAQRDHRARVDGTRTNGPVSLDGTRPNRSASVERCSTSAPATSSTSRSSARSTWISPSARVESPVLARSSDDEAARALADGANAHHVSFAFAAQHRRQIDEELECEALARRQEIVVGEREHD
jgi:hypothetical protein